MHTMTRFEAADYPYAVRMTVTADQIPVLPDSVEFCSRGSSHDAFRLNRPTARPPRWAAPAETEDFITAFREAQERAREYGYELFYSAARVGTLTNHFCGIARDNFCLSPAGNVSACYEAFDEKNPFAEKFFYGASDGDGFRFEMDTLTGLRSLGVEHRPFCDGCFAKWNCAGDCYRKSLAANGCGEPAGSQRCHITRELVKDQLLTRIADAGGLVWRDPKRHACPIHGDCHE